MADFELLSSLTIVFNIGIIVVFIVFINIAIKSTGEVRTRALLLIVAMFMYAIGAIIVNAGLISALEPVLGATVDIYMYIVHAALKSVGIVLLAYGASKW